MKYTSIVVVLFIVAAVAFYYLSRPSYIPWKNNTIIKIVDKTYSEGLPHTSDANTIIMPENAWKDSKKDSTLRHEMVHISQRRNRAAWFQFYKDEWAYEIYKGPIPEELHDVRPNPDTADSPYIVWKGRWLFTALYSDDRTLRNARVVVWDLDTRRFTSIPAEWRAFFEGPTKLNQYEHPHEIAAEYITNGETMKKSVAAQKLFASRIFLHEN